MNASDRPIIIKKVKKVVGGGHHGGAWKVAYADFVTAMMAFFLLMWLINTTDPEARHRRIFRARQRVPDHLRLRRHPRRHVARRGWVQERGIDVGAGTASPGGADGCA